MTLERKVVDRSSYYGLGFPVELRHVTMVKSMGTWGPDLDPLALASSAFRALATKPARLTGKEVRFVRHFMGLKVEPFAELLRVRHPTVLHWEKALENPTKMGWGTEKDIRLRVLKHSGLTGAGFYDAYSVIETLDLEAGEDVVLVYDPADPEQSEGLRWAISGRTRVQRAPR